MRGRSGIEGKFFLGGSLVDRLLFSRLLFSLKMANTAFGLGHRTGILRPGRNRIGRVPTAADAVSRPELTEVTIQ